MKQIIRHITVYFICFLYLWASGGIMLTASYCTGCKIETVSLGEEDEHLCHIENKQKSDCCNSPNDNHTCEKHNQNNCCSKHVLFFKVPDSVNNSTSNNFTPVLLQLLSENNIQNLHLSHLLPRHFQQCNVCTSCFIEPQLEKLCTYLI